MENATEKNHVVVIAPISCGPMLASARWDRDELMRSFLRSTEPQGWIGRDHAYALADAIIEATGKDLKEVAAAT